MSGTSEFQIITPSGYSVSRWAGGATTQLFIYPQTADFKQRDFLFRISTATVEVEESVFTPLPGVSRTLMLLEGAMDLHHEGRHESSLKPFQQDVFEGAWKTSSKGKCSDFNLMTREGCTGQLQALHIAAGDSVDLRVGEGGFLFAFLYNGSLILPGGNSMPEGHSFYAEGPVGLAARAQTPSVLIIASILQVN